MSGLEEQLAKSLTADTVELLEFIPYLLQDLWELGSSPEDMIHLMNKHIPMTEHTKVLDLACGKGAVSIAIAQRFRCPVKGIDIMGEFIREAAARAEAVAVGDLCEFLIGDINRSVTEERGYDITILGAVGDVLGPSGQTLEQVAATLCDGGYLLLDDGYGTSEAAGDYITREQWLQLIEHSRFQFIDELLVDQEAFSAVLDEQLRCISKRAGELSVQHPDLRGLFDHYLESQSAECDQLQDRIWAVTMLLRRR